MDDLDRYLEDLPEHMRAGIRRYLYHGIVPGRFLKAVMENDLVGAFGAADDVNRSILWNYANMLYNAFPPRSTGVWGSVQAVEDWRDVGGLNGLARAPRSFSRADLGEERAMRLCALVNRFGGTGEVVA